MRIEAVPVPEAVATRPRDRRGVHVPAITHWSDGVPQWAVSSGCRQVLCAVQRRCSVCGRRMREGEAEWHAVGRSTARRVAYVLRRAGEFAQPIVTREVPGHEVCMLYSAIVCPFLSSPGGRRRHDGDGLAADVRAGDLRGEESALAGFAPYRLRWRPDRPDLVFTLQLTEPRGLYRYRTGDELIERYQELLAADSAPQEPDPPFLGTNDDHAQAELEHAIRLAVS
ncbi:hypothetical protein ACIQUM_07405 [Amycolatopsis azurea]|uniref:hypothetical protein n=1 Tax=Amycolatopsis azurea TaxID=36819 RepID=UPI0037FEEB7E